MNNNNDSNDGDDANISLVFIYNNAASVVCQSGDLCLLFDFLLKWSFSDPGYKADVIVGVY